MYFLKLCVIVLYGLLLFNSDTQYAAAVPAPASGDNGGWKNPFENFFPGLRANQNPFDIQKTMGDIGNFLGNIAEQAKQVVGDPLKNIFQQIIPQPAVSAGTQTTATSKPTTTTATTTTTTTTTPVPQAKVEENRDIFSSIINSITKGDFGSLLNSFQVKPSTTTTTTTQESAPPQKRGFFDDILGTLFGKNNAVQATTTTTTAITTTTPAPQTKSERGIEALISHIRNLLENGRSLINSLLVKDKRFDLVYIIQHGMEAMNSAKSIGDIFLQRDMEGGIGGVGGELKETMNSVKNITDIMKNAGDIGRLLTLPASLATLIKNLNNLRDDLLSPLLISGGNNISLNIPKEFLAILEPLAQISEFILKIVSPPRRVEPPNDINSLANLTADLVTSVSNIEQMVEKQFPNVKVLEPMGNLMKFVQLVFMNESMDGQNVVNVIEEMFPGTPLEKIVSDYGKMIKNTFPDVPLAQHLGDLMQQNLLVTMFLNMVRSNNFLRYGPLKDSMLQTTGTVGSQLLKMDRTGLLVKTVQLLKDYSTTIEHFMKMSQNLVSQLKPDPKKGNPLGQILEKIPQVLMSLENRKMVMNSLYEINSLLPHSIIMRQIQEVLKNGPKLGNGPISNFIRYWLRGGAIRQLFDFIWGILFRKRNP